MEDQSQKVMTISQAANLSGVSVRTLQYYDKIGLLKPAAVSESGYRLYTQANLQKLQQILFFRELKFPLKDIIKILNQPDFDYQKALMEQRKLLILQKERLEQLIQLTEQGWNEKGELNMNFSAFDKSTIEQYRKEAKERFGKTDAWKESQEKTKGRSKEEWNLVLGEMQELLKRISALVESDPADEEAQQLVEEWRQHITKNYYTCTPEILQGLGQMYCADERFLANIDRYQVGTAQFFAKAIEVYCKNR